MDTILGNLFIGGLIFLAAAALLLPIMAETINRVQLPRTYHFRKFAPTLAGVALAMILFCAWLLAN